MSSVMYITDTLSQKDDHVDGNSESLLKYTIQHCTAHYYTQMNLMQDSYRDNRDNELNYRDIRIFIIAQPQQDEDLPQSKGTICLVT